jgi:flavin reductase (DIM6/NTAB) family NADH-FMN oxidoreductase RutF
MDEDVCRAALLRIPYGLHVVGTRRGEEPHAFTVTWLSQCSFDPLRLMLAVRVGSEGHARIVSESVFSVSFLHRNQEKVAKAFFKRCLAGTGKLNGYAYRRGETGCPVLVDAPAYVECRAVEILSGGDHAVVVGEVIAGGVQGEEPPLNLAQTGWSYKA